MKSMVLKMFFLILALYVGSCYYLYSTQADKIFNRAKVEPIVPKIVKVIKFKTSDNSVLEGAYVQNGKDLPLVLYFGGNASNVMGFLDDMATKIKGYNFVGFNYPGYANSQGVPSQESVLKYANEIYAKYKPAIIAGRSLGSAVAINIASQNNPKGIVLITPIDSILNIAKARYSLLPVSMLLKDKFQADIWAKSLKCKKAVILVEDENIVPEQNVKNILKALGKIDYKTTIKGVNHINMYSKDISNELKTALDSIFI